ncbi:hypothetical protein JTB14_002756 [Gonioctena quinquepunctata]|nr:hypothetical protein JTB14_002756 [Gonioctena quinquepunctata]
MDKKRKSGVHIDQEEGVFWVINILQMMIQNNYFEKAVLTHPDSVPDMENAIPASLYHKCSTDAKPQHQYCPARADSWCAYQKAVATKQNYNNPPAFDQEIQNLLQPIYGELTDEKLLERWNSD